MREADNFAQSDVAQRMKSDMEDLGERVRSKEFESKVRSELLSALKIANDALTKVSNDLSDNQGVSQQTEDQSENGNGTPEPPRGA